MENKENVISTFQCQVVERVSKKGKPYKQVVVVKDGKKYPLSFLNDELIIALFKADVKF